MGSPTTVYQQIKESRLPAAVFSGAFRKLAAPNRAFSKKYGTDRRFNYEKVVSGLNDATLKPEPPKNVPGGVFTLKDAADKIFPPQYPGWALWLIENRKGIAILFIVLFILRALVTRLYLLFAALAAATAGGYVYVSRLAGDKQAADAVIDPQKQVEIPGHHSAAAAIHPQAGRGTSRSFAHNYIINCRQRGGGELPEGIDRDEHTSCAQPAGKGSGSARYGQCASENKSRHRSPRHVP